MIQYICLLPTTTNNNSRQQHQHTNNNRNNFVTHHHTHTHTTSSIIPAILINPQFTIHRCFIPPPQLPNCTNFLHKTSHPSTLVTCCKSRMQHKNNLIKQQSINNKSLHYYHPPYTSTAQPHTRPHKYTVQFFIQRRFNVNGINHGETQAGLNLLSLLKKKTFFFPLLPSSSSTCTQPR